MQSRAFVVLALVAMIINPVASHDEGEAEVVNENSDVVTLTDDNFNSEVGYGKWLVEFYAPWCGHCKHLAPTWEKAATELKGTLKVGKIDCTANNVCGNYGVRGYPTLKYFNNGTPREYSSGRTLDALVAYAHKVTGPLMRSVSADSLKTFQKGTEAKFILFRNPDEEDTKAEDVTEKIAENFLDDAAFGVSSDVSLGAKFGVKTFPAIALTREGEDSQVYTGPWTKEDLSAWVKQGRYPLLGELSAETGQLYQTADIRTVVGVVDHQAKSQEFKKVLKEVAKDFRGQFIFAWIDYNMWASFLTQFDITRDHVPRAFVWHPEQGYHFLNPTPEPTAANLRAFLKGVTDGTIEASGYGKGMWSDLRRSMSGVTKGLGDLWHEYPMYVAGAVILVVAAIGACCCLGGGDEGDFAEEEETDGAAPQGKAARAAKATPAAAGAPAKTAPKPAQTKKTD